jgi:hypothetical protein
VAQVRVFTGDKQWLLQDEEGQSFWVDMWVVEAIAKVIRNVDTLGDKYAITLEKIEKDP